MSDPFVETVRAGIGGLKDTIALAEDLEGVVQQVQDLGKKELAARAAWRRKQVQVNGDYAFIDAVDEYRRVRAAVEMREEIKRQVIAKWGVAGWNEVELIEARQKDDYKRLYTEDGYDREKMFQLKLWSFGLAAVVTFILWVAGVIHDLSVAFYGD